MRPPLRLATTIGIASLALALPLGLAPAALAQVPGIEPAATVCIPFLTGTGCVVFQEARPNRPGTSKGMKVTLTPDVLASGGDLVMEISGFRPREALQRWNYNIFGQERMNEYTGEFLRADRKGRFRWVVSPSTAIYEPSWGKPALCVRGIRSQRLACAEFTVADASGSDGSGGGESGTGSQSPAPAPNPESPSPSPSGTLPPNCRDYGFTVMCTG